MKIFYYITAISLSSFTLFSYYLVGSNSLISYADDGERVSIREDSIQRRTGTYFYSTNRRTPSGGGFSGGK